MKRILILIFIAQPLAGQTFSVIHRKTLQRDERGTIEITQEAINFKAAKEKNSRSWKYTDIQYFDRLSETEFTILTYEDQKVLLGRDKGYRFHITDGVLTDEVFRQLSRRFGRALTNRVVSTVPGVLYQVPVKHLHSLGGCEGTLEFTRDAIYYLTENKEDSREWILERDVQSVWSSDPYRLVIYSYDNNRREFSRTRGYRFDLKAPLDPEFYRKLKLHFFNLEATHLPIR